MAITKNNFSLNQNYETGSVDMKFFTVDFINSMAAETGDVTSGSTTAGLDLVRNTINQYVTILFEGPLTDSGSQKTYGVRADQLDELSATTTLAAIQTAIQALDQASAAYPNIQATITSATVTETKLGILTVAAVA